MFHFIHGTLKKHGMLTYIQNDLIGVEVLYFGSQKFGDYFVYPHLEDNKKTITYFAFDTAEQKSTFEEFLKISGIGIKTAFQIVQIPKKDLFKAVQNLDAKFFQNIPGIGPKSAKKIILEMKGSFELEDLQKIDIDQKLYKSIVSSLRGFGYDANSIKSTLQKYDGKITKENMTEVIKRVISNI